MNRKEIRDLQDRVLDHYRDNLNLPITQGGPLLKDLKECIYPEYRSVLLHLLINAEL